MTKALNKLTKIKANIYYKINILNKYEINNTKRTLRAEV